jgi:hypothetical protein
VDRHLGTKRFGGLHCSSWLPVQPYGIWLCQDSEVVEVLPVVRPEGGSKIIGVTGLAGMVELLF